MSKHVQRVCDTMNLQAKTALMHAGDKGCVKVVSQLLAAGALVDTKDSQVSPVHDTCSYCLC